MPDFANIRMGMVLLALAACKTDETISGYTGTDRSWTLVTLDNAVTPFRASLRFPEQGRIEGRAPCNRFSAPQTAPYPWFEIGPIAATKMACIDLPQESAFFTALRSATLAEVAGDKLILSNENGLEMVFQAGN